MVIGGAGRSGGAAEAEFGWTVLSGIGLVFFLVGALDIVLAWYPLGFGSPAWEFGTVTLSLNGLPTPALGLAMGLASGVALGRRWQVRITAAVLVGIALAVVVSAVVWATNVPLALGSTEDPLGRLGVQRAVIKSAVQILLYPIAFVWIGVAGWRRVEQVDVAWKPEAGETAS